MSYTLELLKAMNDEQLIGNIALSVMGWKQNVKAGHWSVIRKQDGSIVPSSWDPLTNWNHTMEVKKRVMTELRLEDEFTLTLANLMKVNNSDFSTDWALCVLSANQHDICFAALLALSQSKA